MLTGSDSAPAKANEAKQKNDIGAARDDVYLTAQNSQMEAYQTAYVENGISAGEASTTVGNYVRIKLNEKYGTDGNFKTGLATVTATETGNIEISTTDFVIEGNIADKGGNLTWGEIEPNVPRISGVPETLSLNTNSTYTINAKLKGITGEISWSSNKPSIASVSNGIITTATSITTATEQVIITASADGCESKIFTLTVIKDLPYAKYAIPVPLSSSTCAYVKYAMNGKTEENAEMCRVLYNDEEHGLQIITANTVDDNVILGKNDNIGGAIGNTDTEKSQNSYNNAIENLNKHAEKFINKNDQIISDARCVGSVSIMSNNKLENKNNYNNYFTGEFDYLDNKNINGHYKDTDTHYGTNEGTDFKQMALLNISRLSKNYWLASRLVITDSDFTLFTIRYKEKDKDTTYFNELFKILPNKDTISWEYSNCFRPVFLINPTTKIKSGSGTAEDPYILKAGK
ncbi:MAG: hypothetical protein IKF38_05890 [Clostridia bacterium]|nr:hypothetical protein [Clostridia bacterium]